MTFLVELSCLIVIFFCDRFIDFRLEFFILKFQLTKLIGGNVFNVQNVETIVSETFLAPYRGDGDAFAVGTVGPPGIEPIKRFVLYFS